MVALSHVGVSMRGYHLGVPAVVVFLLLSGYVVAAMLHTHPGGWSSPRLFYAERAVRLLPPYYVAWLLGLAAFYTAGMSSPFVSGWQQPALWLASLLVVPLNFAAVAPVLDTFTPVPPAWSLGLELQFYLLAPWLLASTRRMLGALVLTWVVGATAQLGLLPSDAWGYRLLPGNLWIFLLGSCLFHALQRSNGCCARALRLVWLVTLALWLWTAAVGRWGQPFVAEVLGGVVLGLPAVAVLARLPRRAWDDRMADWAYPVFLVHFAVIATAWPTLQQLPHATGWVVYLALVWVLAWWLDRVAQRPVARWRRHLRARQSAILGQPATP
ncbi:peptidoglycan/LPS O-acetylase OafA/YrhL [Tepidimonas ignava]|uniref:Acyltransferase family protein n=2 Tax=Tepidimonas ignava TaxID=114249 RepID=A0A4R3LFE8_9BURK|nr:peptidoglycan/LPS O-acetylase OafA/YrhL [Tepidimonas ignava]TSE20272.1 Acyltransferase family protein [Tepidimonas ignava]